MQKLARNLSEKTSADKASRRIEGDHNIDQAYKIDGFSPMKLKSEFVKNSAL